MPSIVVIGSQWGDEGKGRYVDFLAAKADTVVRYQGGDNAGHTIKSGDMKFALHLVPSGALYDGKKCIIGNGVVVNPKSLLNELKELRKSGLKIDQLYISDRAHVLMPYHITFDSLSENSSDKNKIGTTQKGIGPCYTDMANRCGIRFCDFIDTEVFKELVEKNVEKKNKELKCIYNVEPLDAKAIYDEYIEYAKELAPYVCDTGAMLGNEYAEGKKILFEGAQGTFLDIMLGTYPYVTSSHPTAGGVAIGSGIGPRCIDYALGVAKVYSSRVGKGPFPTEQNNETGDKIREKGHEYGVTTGRPRRCGWLDTVILRYAARVSSLNSLALTHMDTLGDFEKVYMCVAYEYEGKILKDFPASLKVLEKCKPVYEEFEGWNGNIGNIRKFEDLPVNAQKYINAIEKYSGVPVALIGVGQDREQCIVREQLF